MKPFQETSPDKNAKILRGGCSEIAIRVPNSVAMNLAIDCTTAWEGFDRNFRIQQGTDRAILPTSSLREEEDGIANLVVCTVL